MDPVTVAAQVVFEVIDLLVKLAGKDTVQAALSPDVVARDKALTDYVMRLKFGPPPAT